LADSLAGDGELLADLLERVVDAAADAEPHPEDALLPRRQRRERARRLLAQVRVGNGLRRRHRLMIGNDVAEMAVALVAERRLERDRVLHDPDDALHLVEREAETLRDLLLARLAPRLLHHQANRARDLVERLHHVHRHADGARLIGDRPADGLPDPPRRVGREAVAEPIVELLDGAHEADVPLLDEVEEREAALRVPFREAHDEPEIRLDEPGLRVLRLTFAVADRGDDARQLRGRDAGAALDGAHLAEGARGFGRERLDLLRSDAAGREEALRLAQPARLRAPPATIGERRVREPGEIDAAALIPL